MNKSPVYEPADIVRPYGRAIPEAIARCAKFYKIRHNNIGLRIMLAIAPQDDPRGSIIFCPGRTEFIEKYFETAQDFLNRGFNVLIMDPRGQGLSDRLLPNPLKSYVKDFQDYADDLAFAATTFEALLPKPHILMGHSMGGCVVLQAIISGVMNPSAVICSAPMLGLFDIESPLTAWIIKMIGAAGLAKKNLPFQKQEGGLPVSFETNKLTSDPKRFDRWASYSTTTPALRVAGPTFGWLTAALKAMNYVNRNAQQLKVPGLIVAAGGDPIVDPASNFNFAHSANLQYVVVPGALHEVLMEKDHYRKQFFKHLDDFLKQEGL